MKKLCSDEMVGVSGGLCFCVIFTARGEFMKPGVFEPTSEACIKRCCLDDCLKGYVTVSWYFSDIFPQDEDVFKDCPDMGNWINR